MTNIELKSLKGVEFFLGANKHVNSLEDGAEKYGGATKFDDGIYSNYDNGKNTIEVSEKENCLSIIIPSTLNVDEQVDNTMYVNRCKKIMNNYYKNCQINTYKSVGSWYSDDLKKVIVEKNSILSIKLGTVTEKDIQFLLNVGKFVKKEMTQENVSVLVNSALCLV